MVNNYAEIVSWVLTNLGYPSVDVEVTEDMIVTAYKDALQTFSKYAGYETTFKEYTFMTQPDLDVYQMPDDCDFVFKVARRTSLINSIGDLYGYNVADDLLLLFNTQGKTFNLFKNLAGFHISTHYLKAINRVFGIEPSFEPWTGNSIKIYPIPRGNYLSVALYCPKIDLNSNVSYNIWIKNYTLYKTMWMLGNIYQKYPQGIPGAAGGQSQAIMLRQDLVEKAEAKMEKLVNDDIRSFRCDYMIVG